MRPYYDVLGNSKPSISAGERGAISTIYLPREKLGHLPLALARQKTEIPFTQTKVKTQHNTHNQIQTSITILLRPFVLWDFFNPAFPEKAGFIHRLPTSQPDNTV